MEILPPPPALRLSSGLVVVNFSSPHPFQFDDQGKVVELAACDPERSRRLSLEAVEVETNQGLWTDIGLNFLMDDAACAELRRLVSGGPCQATKTIVVCPRIVVDAAKIHFGDDWVKRMGIRTIRSKDRITKVCYGDRFCV